MQNSVANGMRNFGMKYDMFHKIHFVIGEGWIIAFILTNGAEIL